MKLIERHVPAGSLRGVTEALALSYARLTPEEQRAARLIAQLAPEPIPVRLLDELGMEVMTPAARVTLRSRHFVTPVEGAGEVGLFGSMHRVLADFLRGQSREDGEELKQVCQALVALLRADACRDPREWPLLSVALPHAESVFERGETLLPRPLARTKTSFVRRLGMALGLLPGPLVRTKEPPIVLRLGNALGLFLSARGLAKQARGSEERVLAQSMRFLGPEHPDTLTAMNNLAVILRRQGDI
jgi:hypothetical protein